MLRILAFISALLLTIVAARADFVFSSNVLQTVETFMNAGKILPKSVPADTAGAALGVSGNPFAVSGTVTANQVSPWTVNPGTAANWGVGATGAAAPPSGVYHGINIGGNLTGVTGATRGSENAMSVQIVDGSGNQITSFGNAANIGATASSVPSSANYNGVNVGGDLRGVTGLSLGATVSPTIAIVDGSGNQVTSFGGSIVALGATSDAACSTDTGTCSLIALQKRANQNLTSSTVGTGTAGAPNSGVLSVQEPGDPCKYIAKVHTPISITAATTTRIVAPVSAKKTYICNLFLTSAAGDNVGIVEGTGGTCGAGTAGVIGGATAANGPNFAANGGFSIGNGSATVAATAGTNVDLCLITSAATPLAGVIGWVQAP